MESVHPVHKPWIEITPESNVTWEPERADMYSGPMGGGDPGPTTWIQQIVRQAETLACIFLALIPMSFFVQVANYSQRYAYTDWVIAKLGTDRDGNPRKKEHFEPCRADTPGCRH